MKLRAPAAFGFAMGATVAALMVIASLGPGDVLFWPSFALLLPGLAAGGIGLVRRARDPGPDPTPQMRSDTPRFFLGVLAGAVAVVLLAGSALAAMFSGLR